MGVEVGVGERLLLCRLRGGSVKASDALTLAILAAGKETAIHFYNYESEYSQKGNHQRVHHFCRLNVHFHFRC